MRRPWFQGLLRAGGSLLLVGVAACAGEESRPPKVMRLVRPLLPADPSQPYQTQARLNDELRFHFSESVDRLSVTRESVLITDEHGREAVGRFEVEGASVRFVPTLPLARDLSDAGLLPGRRHRVELRGYPAPDGLRAASGAPLASGLVARFETVPFEGARSKPGALFTDRLQGRTGLLRFHPPVPRATENQSLYSIPSTGSLYLVCDKPIDPSTLEAEAFVLELKSSGARIPLSVRLVENESTCVARPIPPALRSRPNVPGGWDSLQRAAVIELTPRESLTPSDFGEFSFRVDSHGEVGVRGLGGQPLVRASSRPVTVWFHEAFRDPPAGNYSEDFLRSTRGTLRAQVAVPGFDGTPAWTDTGRVEVRYPAAAGSGRDGRVELGPVESRTDVHAERLVLAGGVTCDLGAGSGTRILRSQGSLVIGGDLVRSGAATSEAALAAYEPELFYDRGATTPPMAFSAWLERAFDPERRPVVGPDPSAPDRNPQPPPAWTVLVAGGDLTIDGRIEVDGPLLLCAGGMLRIAGQVRGAKSSGIGQVWILGEGGGIAVHPAPNVIRSALVLDPPVGANPLLAPLRFCVRSQTLPQADTLVRWLSAEARGSDASRNGKWKVHFLSAADLASTADPRTAWVEDPALLPAGTDGWGRPLVYFIELEVPAGGVWAPPFVDALRLQWEERRGGAR